MVSASWVRMDTKNNRKRFFFFNGIRFSEKKAPCNSFNSSSITGIGKFFLTALELKFDNQFKNI